MIRLTGIKWFGIISLTPILIFFFFSISPSLTGNEGQKLVQSRCMKCHNLERVAYMLGLKDKKNWESTVNRMAMKGAQVNSDEQAIIVEYLSNLKKGEKP